MRWYSQILLIGIVGGTGYAGWQYWPQIRPVYEEMRAHAPFLPQIGQPPAPQQQQAQRPQQGPGGPPPVVEVTTIGTDRIVEVTEAVGTTRAFESVAITPKVAGIVQEITFDEGQIVETGQVLVRLDVAERQADLEAARAAIVTSQAQRNEIAQRLERARQLRATGAGTEAQVTDLTLQMRTAETNIVTAQARMRASEARLNDLVVRAPFAGRVGIRQISLGAYVEARNVVTTLDDLSQVRLDFSVPEGLLARLQVGTVVRTRNIAYGERDFEGRVAVVDTRVDPVTRSIRLTALIPNPGYLLRPGMFMNVSLEVATRENATIVPEEALVAEGPRQLAFVVVNGRIERRVVRIGQREPGRVEVVEGVSPGETLVVRGVQRIRHGMPVTARPVQPAAPPPAPQQRPTQRENGVSAGQLPSPTPQPVRPQTQSN